MKGAERGRPVVRNLQAVDADQRKLLAGRVRKLRTTVSKLDSREAYMAGFITQSNLAVD